MGGPSKTITFRGDTSGLEVDLDTALDRVNKRAGSLFARLPKDIQKGLIEAQSKTVEAVKGAIVHSVASAGLAISGPARTTFDQAIRAANDFRRETSKIAVATGNDLGSVGARVDLVSRAIGEMPQTTMSWARSVARLTGDFDGAIDSLIGMKDVALALDVPIEELTDSMVGLRNTFGVRSTEDVRKFFGTMNAQARATGTEFKILSRQVSAFMPEFSRMGATGPGAMTAMAASFLGSEKNPEQAARNQAFGMGTLNQGARLVEMRMRRAGFGKGFSITDDMGSIGTGENYIKAMQFMQRDMLRFYGGNKRRAIEVQAGEDLGARRAVGGFLNTDFSKVQSLADLPPEVLDAAEKYFGMDAGARDRAEVEKNRRDREAGKPMLRAQDAAVRAGGGAVGLAMEAATGAFGQAVDRFGNAVLTFIGRGAPMAAGASGAAVAGGASAAGAAAPALLGGAAKIGGAAMPLLGSLGIGVAAGMYADHAFGISDWISEKAYNMAPGLSDWWNGAPAISGGNDGRPREVALSPAATRAQAEAMAQALSTKVLKTQAVPTYGPPAPEEAAK